LRCAQKTRLYASCSAQTDLWCWEFPRYSSIVLLFQSHVILEHRGILEAIREGNEKDAVKAMRYHLDCTAKRTLNHIIAELDEEL